MNACESHNPLTCTVLNVDQLTLLCSLCVPDTVSEFDLCALSLVCPFTAILLFTVSFTVSGGDSLFILYSNKDTNAYVPKTYSNANNIYSIAYTTSDTLSSVIYSIDLRSRKFASQFEL